MTDDDLGRVFAALADPTRRRIVDTFLQQGSTSVPELTLTLPISRQAVAKHLATLDAAGLIERSAGGGREVRYSLRQGALGPAATWLARTDAAWEDRLVRLKGAVERGRSARK